jgi:aspartate kinase
MVAKDLKIFKFGGASINSSQRVKNLAEIVRSHKGNLIVVISAMGKTTNALEQILSNFLVSKTIQGEGFNQLKDYHLKIIKELLGNEKIDAIDALHSIFNQMEKLSTELSMSDYNFAYDQLVSFGELLSSTIVSFYLNQQGISNEWVDIRQLLRTDITYREGNVDFSVSGECCKKIFNFEGQQVYVTQGFIAGTEEGTTTTLGREGSDYTAAILANLLNAQSVTIWKDVEGVLNADPRIFQDTIKLREVSFKEAIELAYCGAQIIHPKTIKPLQNKQISLYVKSFLNPSSEGTLVYQTDSHIAYPPIFIKKFRQVLISLTPIDFSFVIEDCLSKIFAILYKHRVKANLVQSSAISFSICVDDEEYFLPAAIVELQESFSVRYNSNLELLTVRHYTPESIEVNTRNRKLFLQQLTRNTARFIMASVDMDSSALP